jgi:Fe-S-cluster containining protein
VFTCENCGSCCRAIGCDKLIGNDCSIYSDRPLECRVDENRPDGVSEDKWHRDNKGVCKILRGEI